MKKIYYLIFLSIVASGLWAQVPQYFNFNTTAGSNVFPWGTATKKVQWRIPANSLGSVGAGNNITVIYFYMNSNTTGTYPILNIGLRQGLAQFTSAGNFETGFTNVYAGVNVTKTSVTSAWMSFTLSTPFLYDPTQPLFIDVEQNGTTSNSMSQNQSSPTGPGNGRLYGLYGQTAYQGADATVAHFGIDVVPAVPCSTTPSTNSIVGPTAAICPNGTANMNVTNTYTAASGGIAYQWQYSTTSAVGPFTAVPNATNSAYAAPNITTTTWYTALITCTNVTGTITSAPYSVSVSPVTTSNVPYYESFEGIAVDNKLPNCSWSASNLPTNCQTYTQSNTLGRMPRTGSKFAAFYNAPAGANYFYTNGINLTAGITYSASVWYETEYYGYNNWTDLSILYGTTQTAAGQVTIASTNGAAVTNVYKSLSNTFSVPTTGLYYIAVRGTATSGSAPYLTWDDLSITIPCDTNSPNSPNVILSANSTTICEGESVILTAAGADSYTWSTGANTSMITEMPGGNISYDVVGTNTLTGCTSTVTQNIYVNPAPQPFIVPSKVTTCAGSPVLLTAMGANSYTWTTGGTTSVTSVSPLTTTSYSVMAENMFGCVGQAVQTINVNQLPNVQAASGSASFYCMNDPLVLTATGAQSYQWTSNTSSIIHAGTPITVMLNANTTFTVIGTDGNGCQKTITLSQNVETCTGINNNSMSANGIKLFPNPAKTEFTVESDASTKKIEVFDVTGKVVISQNNAKGTTVINVSSLANGVYYVKVQSDSYSEVIKLVKE